MYSTASIAQADLSRLFWDGYRQGVAGLPRKNNVHSGTQAQHYEQGYEQGLEVYEVTRVGLEYTGIPQPRNVINQVLTMRDKIDLHLAQVADLESQILRLESGA